MSDGGSTGREEAASASPLPQPEPPRQFPTATISVLLLIVFAATVPVLADLLADPDRAVNYRWLWWTDDQWGLAGDAATVMGLLFALIAGAVAYLTYRTASDATADQHMHTLFRDYLRMRFDHDLAMLGVRNRPYGRVATRKGLEEQLAGAKLYALEEMWSWTCRRERAAFYTLKYLPGGPRRRDVLSAWRATIAVHVNQERIDVAESILTYSECYSLSFLDFIAKRWAGDRKEFAALVKDETKRRKEGKQWKRPLPAEIAEWSRRLASVPE